MAVIIDGTTGLTTSGSSSSGGGGVSTSTALGGGALFTNSSGANLVAIGYQAGYSTTAGPNVFVGSQAGYTNSTGTSNIGIGYQALYSNTTASNNTAVGYQAGYAATTGYANALVGYQAGKAITTGVGNVCMGYLAGYTNISSNNNTYIGNQAGANATGEYNTCIGFASGSSITTGTKNTILGGYNGNQGSLDIRTASNYIVLSDGDGNPRAWIGAGNNNDLFRVGTTSTSTASFMHQIAYSQVSRFVLGITNDVSSGGPSGLSISYPNVAATASTDYFLYCANSTTARAIIKNDGGLSNFSGNNSNLSDRREKKDFEPSKPYLETICAIPVQTFNYIDQADDIKTLGVVAQDVEAVAPELVHESDWGTKENPRIRLSVYQTDLQFALMKSIQELKTIVDAQAARIATLEAR